MRPNLDSQHKTLENNIKLSQKYTYRPFILIYQTLEKGQRAHVLIPGYTGSKTVAKDLHEVVTNSKNSLVRVLGGSTSFTKSDQIQWCIDINDIVKYNKSLLLKEIKRAHRNNRTYILGISMFANDRKVLEIINMISDLKSTYPNIIIVLGGPEFNSIHSIKSYESYFEQGVDIINIGGHIELTNLIGNISDTEHFSRDSKGLHFHSDRQVPSNILLSGEEIEVEKLKIGNSKTVHPIIIKEMGKLVYHINGSGCLNSCDFCSEKRDRNKMITCKDIERIANDLQSHIDLTAEYNTFSGGIELEISNPNPMQNLKKFVSLLNRLDLSKVGSLCLFGDFIGLHSDENFETHCRMVENLAQKYPNLNLIYAWGVDAIQYENDGEFIGKRLGRKIITQKYYDKALNNLKILIAKTSFLTSDTLCHWHNINLIIHPAMGIEEFEKKSSLCDYFESLDETRISIRKFVLSPFKGTKIANELGEYSLSNNSEILSDEEKAQHFEELWVNNWSHFFKNSHLIDAHILINSVIWKTQVIKFLKSAIKKSGDINMYFFSYIIHNLIRTISSWIIEDTKGERNESYKIIINNMIMYLGFMRDRDKFINKKVRESLPNKLINAWADILDILIGHLRLIETEIGADSSDKLKNVILPLIENEDNVLYKSLSKIRRPKY